MTPARIDANCGFRVEGVLKDGSFVNVCYRDAVRMCLFQPDYLRARGGGGDIAEPVLKV